MGASVNPMTNETLEPISPAEAKEMYLNARKHEVSQSTLDGYHYRLKHFIRWCNEVADIDNMNDSPDGNSKSSERGGATGVVVTSHL